MLGEIQIIKRKMVKTLVIRKTCAIENLPKITLEAYTKIRKYMGKMGAMSAGVPYVAYLNQDMKNMKVEIGIPIAMYVPNMEEIVMSEIPEGEYVRAIYTGAYVGLKEAYNLMNEYMNVHNISGEMRVYESYMNEPANTPEDELLTEILISI